MPTPATSRSRTAREYRLGGVDAARALALIGMMAVHVQPRLDADGGVTTAYLVAGGRSSALFAVLAGVGLALASGGRTPPAGRPYAAFGVATLVRAMALAVIGVGLGSLEDNRVAVILVYYAVMFVLAIPFIALSARALAWLSAGVAVVVPVVSHVARDMLPAAALDSPSTEWLARPMPEVMSELLITGIYPALPWMAYLFAGMAVGRSVMDRPFAWRLLVGGASVALGARLLSEFLLARWGEAALLDAGGDRFGRPLDIALDSGLFGVTPTTTPWWLAVAAPHSATPLDLIGTTGSALAVLGLMLLLVRPGQWWSRPLTAAGAMPLSLYSLHVLLLATVLGPDVAHAYLWHVLVALSVGLWWQSVVGRGPLEAATRWLGAGAAELAFPDVARRSP